MKLELPLSDYLGLDPPARQLNSVGKFKKYALDLFDFFYLFFSN
jgi:hypothetical protein